MNGSLKSQRSFMLTLIKGLLDDCKQLHDLPPSGFDRDFVTIQNRTEAEGLQFLTKTLPLLGKSLDSYLAGNSFCSPSNFRCSKSTKLPLIFNGLFALVVGGNHVDETACIAAITSLRQLCYLFYKYELPYNQALVAKTVRNFFDVDANLLEEAPDVEAMSTVYYAKEVVNEVFKNFKNDQFYAGNGPGSVANGAKPFERYKPFKLYKSLDDLLPFDRCYFYNDRHLFDHFQLWYALPERSCGTAKLMAVPKDSRGPRLISSEQSEFMTFQQALKNSLVPFLENNAITKGRVNFTNQEINGKLALESSRTGANATLDLSEASDRLSLWLVDLLFEDTSIHEYLLKSRSTSTSYEGSQHTLKKFAPMGSALCFPIQAMTFYSVIVGALLREGVSWRAATRCVYVYGDDIIIPTKYYQVATQALISVGLKINEDKSCFAGLFRESCGTDAFNGVDVTPIKVKKVWQKKPSAQLIQAYCALSDNFFFKGYWKASDIIRRLLKTTIPIVLKTVNSPIVGLTAWNKTHAMKANQRLLRWSLPLQCWQLKAFVLKAQSFQAKMTGWEKMLRFAWEKSRSEIGSPNGKWTFDEAPFSPAQFTSRDNVIKTLRVVYESSF